ncbi:hypothetical protein IE53DRAFT_402306 [Violaceomyces palustris]|uniref:Uncharacterized protein n=1 Tax=Violaceomyces palustris TaxID=1673888 RepID=A0ACD0NNP7_9BASI|nr:hypothetical protein IE53DRAFT_402306 [Violaceomyces palustris]
MDLDPYPPPPSPSPPDIIYSFSYSFPKWLFFSPSPLLSHSISRFRSLTHSLIPTKSTNPALARKKKQTLLLRGFSISLSTYKPQSPAPPLPKVFRSKLSSLKRTSILPPLLYPRFLRQGSPLRQNDEDMKERKKERTKGRGKGRNYRPHICMVLCSLSVHLRQRRVLQVEKQVIARGE